MQNGTEFLIDGKAYRECVFWVLTSGPLYSDAPYGGYMQLHLKRCLKASFLRDASLGYGSYKWLQQRGVLIASI